MKRRAFTLIEMSVVLLVIAMFAAAIAPNIGNAIEGGRKRGFQQSVLTLIRQAKVEAVNRGQTVTLQTTSDAGFQIVVQANNEDQPIKEVNPVTGVEVQNLTKGTETLSENEWTVQFFPDGTCEGGRFEFSQDSQIRSVSIAKFDGSVTVQNGEIDPTTDADREWQAGDYVKAG